MNSSQESLREKEENTQLSDLLQHPKQPELLAAGSKELESYINKLSQESKSINPKSLCGSCWCKLTYNQKLQHFEQHVLNDVKKPGQFADMKGFQTYAHRYGHFKEIDGVVYYEVIKENPPACMQGKRIKLTEEVEGDGKAGKQVQIKIGKISSPKGPKENSVLNKAQPEETKSQKEGQVILLMFYFFLTC